MFIVLQVHCLSVCDRLSRLRYENTRFLMIFHVLNGIFNKRYEKIAKQVVTVSLNTCTCFYIFNFLESLPIFFFFNLIMNFCLFHNRPCFAFLLITNNLAYLFNLRIAMIFNLLTILHIYFSYNSDGFHFNICSCIYFPRCLFQLLNCSLDLSLNVHLQFIMLMKA